MKKGLFVAVLLSTTALTSPAQAAPVIGFFQGIAAAFGSAAAAGAVGAAGFATGFAVGGFLTGTFVGKLILNLAVSAILSALAPRPSVPPPSELLANYSQPISYMERGYGTVRKGGPIGFTGFNDLKRHYAVLIAAHPTDGPVQHYLDRRSATIDGSGDVQTAPMAGYGNIRTYTGGASQAADATLVSNFTEITSSHDFEGLSYAALWAARAPNNVITEVYPNGREWAYNPVWKMHNQIYDPRTATTGWSDNWALCFAHELVNYFGVEVDWDEVGDEADICDQLVTNKAGTQQKRWTFNRAFRDDQTFDDIQAQFLGAADGFVYERTDGKVGFKAGRWIEPTITLTEADFVAVSVGEGRPGEQSPNEFVANYVEPINGYLESPTGVIAVNDGLRIKRDEINIFGVDSHNQAARALSRYSKLKRAQYSLRGTVKLIGYELIGVRFVNFNHTELGLTFPIEISKLTRQANGFLFDLEAVSVASTDFDFTAATDEPNRPVYDEVVSDNTVANVTGLTGTAQDSSGGSATILWGWPTQDASLQQDIRVRPVGGSYQVVQVPQGQSDYLMTGLVDGTTYQAQVRNRTAAARESDWKPDATVEVEAVANSTAPAALGSFSATENAGDVDITFDAPNDPNYSATRISRGTTNVLTDASVVHTEYGIPSNSDTWTDTGLSADTYYYWAAPINPSGVAGTTSGPQSVTIT